MWKLAGIYPIESFLRYRGCRRAVYHAEFSWVPGSLNRAVIFVSGQEELRHILSQPFAEWRTFLHPSQRKIAYRADYSGPVQLTGGPGTGKTVTLLHRAAFLAEHAETASVSEPGGQVLVTAFNGILADSLAAQLDLLVPTTCAAGCK